MLSGFKNVVIVSHNICNKVNYGYLLIILVNETYLRNYVCNV